MGDRKEEEDEAVRMSCCGLQVGGWVGGWVGGLPVSLSIFKAVSKAVRARRGSCALMASMPSWREWVGGWVVG